MTKRWLFAVLAVVAVSIGLTVEVMAAARPWQLGFQDPASPVQARFDNLHNILLWVITLITLFVLALLVYVMVRFRKSANPTPSRNVHNTPLEIAWTVVPVLILVLISIPSLRLLYFMDRTEQADMTIKVRAHQWYWNYEYPDHGGFNFDSRLAEAAGRRDAAGAGPQGQLRLLDVDNRIVVPVGANIRVLVNSADVMHSWFVPPAGVQIYAVTGRTNETWMRIERPGVYYGQCNQICGIDHGYMPIAIEAMPREQFDRWVGEARRRFAADTPATNLAAAPAAAAQ
jgi:cytochrome c oxidase subunit II